MSYTKQTWANGDIITAAKLNHMEDGIAGVEADVSSLDTQLLASMPHDTASGSIASFPDGAAMPVRDLSVAIEPVQDLNGYDNPWPSGGGKNLFDKDAPGKQVGYALDYDNGSTYQTGSGNYSTSDFIPVVAGQNYIASGNSKATDYCWYDSGKVFISGGGNIDTAKTAPSNAAYARIDYWKADENSIQFEQNSSATSYAPYSNICPISGWTECKVTRTGKNLLPKTTYQSQTVNGTTFTVNSDGSITVSGTPSVQTRVNLASGLFWTAKQVETFGSGTMPTGTRFFCTRVRNGVTSYPTVSPTATAQVGDEYSNLLLEVNTTFDGSAFTVYPQIELGSSATAYEPYQGQTYTIDLDGTRYGGTLDVTSGKLTVTMASVDLGTLTWTKRNTSTGHWRFTTQDIPIKWNENNSSVGNMLCSIYPAVSANDTYNGITGVSSHTAQTQLLVCDETYTDAATFKTAMSGVQLVYELATPIEVDLDPVTISTLLGTNNIFADCGDTTVDYYADTTLFVNKKIAAAVAALS